jgi:hypothetical protein
MEVHGAWKTPGPGGALRYPASASLSNEERRLGGAISGASGRLQAGLAVGAWPGVCNSFGPCEGLACDF